MHDYEYRPCGLCDAGFACRPELVPYLYGRPVCSDCIDAVNAMRDELDIPRVRVHPGAYRKVAM